MKNKSSDRIEIAFAINEGYVTPLCTVIFSILKNNVNQSIRFHVCGSGLSKNSRQRLDEICSRCPQASIEYIEINDKMFDGINMSIKHISIETYFRFLLAELLPDIDRVLYMDADIIVDGSLSALWNIDMQDNLLAGVRDEYIESVNIKHKKQIGLSQDSLYVNAGILLMNLRLLRAELPGKRLIEMTKELENKISYQDQDVLNIACHQRIMELKPTWNMTYDSAMISDDDVPIIIHYNGPDKPWHRGCCHPYRMIYIKYYVGLPGANLDAVVEWLKPVPNRWKYCILGIPVLKVQEKHIKKSRSTMYWLFGFIPIIKVVER